MPQSVMWKELTAADLRAKAQAGAIVLLPVASMEQHGPHLPVGVDTFLSEGVCKAAAEAIAAETAGRGGADAVVRHGRASHGLRRHLHVRYPDLSGRAALPAEEHGAARLQARADRQRPRRQHRRAGAFLPDFAREIRAWRCASPRPTSRRRRPSRRSSRTRSGVHHACEVETSMMMVVAPDTVRHDKLAEAHGPPHWTPQPARRCALRLVPRGHRRRA